MKSGKKVIARLLTVAGIGAAVYFAFPSYNAFKESGTLNGRHEMGEITYSEYEKATKEIVAKEWGFTATAIVLGVGTITTSIVYNKKQKKQKAKNNVDESSNSL